MGYRMIAAQAGLIAIQAAPGQPVKIDDPKWQGYLANIAPSEFEQTYAASLPQHLAGDEFLDNYTNTTDPLTQVNPQTLYAVRTPTTHPIYDHFRAQSYAELLNQAPVNERQLELLGELMYQSHTSYSACNLGSSGTDRLVRLVRQAGPRHGLYGAKITGNGSGGTIAVLGRRDAGAAIQAIAEQYAQQTGYQPYIFSGSSPGAAGFGTIRLRAEG
jgi:L-arabinokinase